MNSKGVVALSDQCGSLFLSLRYFFCKHSGSGMAVFPVMS